MVDALLWSFKTGAPWRDLPGYYGPWKTTCNNFLRRPDADVWEHILENLNAEGERPWQTMIDSTIVKAHQHSAGAKKRMITIKVLADPGEDRQVNCTLRRMRRASVESVVVRRESE